VQLDGSASRDPDGDGLTFAWSLVRAPSWRSTAALSDTTTVAPTFLPDWAGVYEFELAVSDGTLWSARDTVRVRANTPPRAAVWTPGFGEVLLVPVGVPYALPGIPGDEDDDPLTYAWTVLRKPSGSHPTLTNTTSISPTFVADLPGRYDVELVVDDNVARDSDRATIIAVGELQFDPARVYFSGGIEHRGRTVPCVASVDEPDVIALGVQFPPPP
jgi:chitinase